MSEGFEKKLIVPAGHVTTILALVAFGTFGVFLFQIAERGFYALVGWQYDFHSISDALHLNDNRGLYGWDRSFLFLAAAVGAFYSAMGVEAFVDWARKSPEQRQRDRERAAEAKHAAKMAEAAERQRVEKEKKERKAARKPMSGWRRLWIVLSVIFGVAAGVVSWQPTYSEYVVVDPTTFKDWDEFWKLPMVETAMSNCGAGTIRARFAFGSGASTNYRLECPAKDPLTTSLLWALVPGLIMAAVGLIVRWVYRGFRPLAAGGGLST